MDERITVRPLRTLAEFRACHGVQKEAWSFPDLLVIPYTQLFTVSRHGGVVLGAFDGGTLVGFVLGFLGREKDGSLYVFSQRMGVLPDHQGKGIGEKLKWAQRAWAVEQGLDRILWTYDPLEAPNAYLNVTKLGGLVRRYERDLYGQHHGPANVGLPTDRFLVEWELLNERVLERLHPEWTIPSFDAWLAEAGRPLNHVGWDARGLPISGPARLEEKGSALLVEVPADWQGLRRMDMALAADWREKIRLVFEHYLGQGYAVTGYATGLKAGRRRNAYALEKIT